MNAGLAETESAAEVDPAVGTPERSGASQPPAGHAPARPGAQRFVRRALLVLGLLGLAVTATYLVLRPTSVEVAAAARHDLRLSAHGVGTVEAKTVVDLSPKISGRLTSVLVDEGDPVRQGQVLASVDDAELRAELERVEAAHARSRTTVSVEEARLGRARAALAASRAAVARARATGALATRNARRWRQLYEEGVVAMADREARETEAIVGDETLAAAMADLAAAEREVDASAASLEMVRHDVLATEADVAAARARLGDTTVISPVDGYVVRRLLEPGALAVQGAPILRVADPATAWVTIYLNEAEAGSVSAGDAAEIALRSSPADSIPGHVARVRHESDRVTEQLAVDIAFNDPPRRLVLGEQAEATISGPDRRGVLAVPLSAMVRSDAGTSVLVVANERLTIVPVQLGLTDGSGLVEVVSGLEQGQFVVTAPGKLAEPANEGRRVRPVLTAAAPDEGRAP